MTPIAWMIRTSGGVEFFHRRPPAAANVKPGDVVWEPVYDPRDVAALQAERDAHIDRIALLGERLLEHDVEHDALKAENDLLRGALADIAYSRDMTLFLARKKAQRIYTDCINADKRDEGEAR